jgi:hypothetical protein
MGIDGIIARALMEHGPNSAIARSLESTDRATVERGVIRTVAERLRLPIIGA